MIHRRNRFYAEVFEYFRASDRFMVVNIHKEGAISEAFAMMTLPAPASPEKANSSGADYPFDNYENVQRALEETIEESEHSASFLIPSLTPDDVLARLSSDDPRLLI